MALDFCRFLGRRGLRVSSLCVGTMTFDTAIEPGYPHDYLANSSVRRYIFGGATLETE